MSVKTMSLVWDMECPTKWAELPFEASHKFVLIAYADHADHQGRSIYPAVPTIAKKTGLSDRTVQRLTHDLETMGIIIKDGAGPKGTNRWKLSLSPRGDMVSPVTRRGGDMDDESLGDIPSGDMVSPELNQNQENIYILEKIFSTYDWWHNFQKATQNAKVEIVGTSIIVSRLGKRAEIIDEQYGQTIRRQLHATKYQGVTFLE